MRFLYYFLSFLSLTSCASSQYAKELTKLVSNQKTTEQKLQELSVMLNEKTLDEIQKNELNQEIATKIEGNLNKALALSKTNEQMAEEILKKLTSKKQKLVKQGMAESKIFLARSGSFIDSVMIRLELINDLYSVPTMKVFQTAAFFPSGEYKIPDQYVTKLYTDFSPVLEDVVVFADKYKQVQLVAVLNTQGYADSQGFNMSSDIGQRLSEMIGKQNPSRQELNLMISQLRAEELGHFMESILKQKQEKLSNANIELIDLKWEGKGEEYPNLSIKNYKDDDERRRIVIFFWNILPIEFLDKK